MEMARLDLDRGIMFFVPLGILGPNRTILGPIRTMTMGAEGKNSNIRWFDDPTCPHL